MIYIDLASGEVVTPSGNRTHRKVHFIEAELHEFEFAFLKNHKRYTFPENTEVTLLGDVSENNDSVMFISHGVISEGRKSVKFVIDTYTSEYFQRVKASATPCFVDLLCREVGSERYSRLVRFEALADSRLAVEGMPPEPLAEYYTKKEIDQLLAGTSAGSNILLDKAQTETMTLPPGSPARADVKINEHEGKNVFCFSFGIPQGEKGEKGDTGEQGSKGDKGDKGDTGEQGPKGEKGDAGEQGSKGDKGDKGDTGKQGPQGIAGSTPQRGIDYWTAEDIASIENYVNNAILNGEW